MVSDIAAVVGHLVVERAEVSIDFPGVVYGVVHFKGSTYTLQYSRPRHPSDADRLLEEGATIYFDDGHDDNVDLMRAVEEEADWCDVEPFIIRAADAVAALDRSCS